MTGYVLKAAFAAAMSLASAQPASAACWNTQQAAAAKVRDLQSRLMVATLRCQAMGYDVSPAYNQFVRANRDTIQAANGLIKAQFATASGGDGEQLYDSFATALANAYGAGQTNSDICRDTESAEQEGGQAAGDVSLLLALADRLGPPPALPGGTCPITFSQR
ncbi:MAG: hypothetical protein JWO25_1110 [Alphaproteobacteria bacterium]|nr:hypothetical protein [Alphaproteobacteria bacterium]